MAIKPLVLVFQELRAPSASIINPTLTGCVVGPHYLVKTYAEHHDEVQAGLYDAANGNVLAAMPGAVAGMKLRTQGFKLYLDNARVVIDSGTAATFTKNGLLTAANTEDFSATGTTVKAGDTVKLTSGSTVRYATVLKVPSKYTVVVSTGSFFTYASNADTLSDITWEVTRKVDAAEVLAAGYTVDTVTNSVTVNPAVQTTVDGLTRDVVDYGGTIAANQLVTTVATADQAVMLVEYTALDTRFAHIPAKISSAADVVTQLGLADSRNPLGLGAQIMFQNGQASFSALGLESEDDTGWTLAIDAINRGKFYAQALLTDEASIIAAYKANAVANEVPEKAQYMEVIGNHKLPTSVTPATGTGTASIDLSSGLKVMFEDTSADFTNTAQPVLAGDILTVAGTEYTIDDVVNSTRLQVMASLPFGSGQNSGLAYTVTRTLTKDQQAEAVAANSRALKNKRCIMTFSDLVEINGEELPGYYLNCAVAGMIIGLPAQAGITNKGIAGIDKVKHTNWDYFTEEQLDVMATAGTLIFVQDTDSSLPYVRHQLTTDPALLETGEISVVKNNDYLSLFFKGLLKPYLGEWNVTPELLLALNMAIMQGIQFQLNNKVAKIGAPLLSASIKKLEISSVSPDRVEVTIDTVQPKPLNTVGLHMIL